MSGVTFAVGLLPVGLLTTDLLATDLRSVGLLTMDLLDSLRQCLRERPGLDLPPHGHMRAAVLVPVFEAGGVPHLLLTRRTDLVEHHKGQISFPGGRAEEGDADLLATALRETQEEIGLAPGSVEILGRLDECRTVASGFAITPYVGLIPPPEALIPNPVEIDSLIVVPLPVFLDAANLRVERVTFEDGEHEVVSYEYPPHVIWGVTARIIRQMVGLLGTGTGRRG
jgi:8-oxo-dGTP pyrophosphatase MutT (NUDIX family)